MTARSLVVSCVALASCSTCLRGKADPSFRAAVTRLTAAVEATVRHRSSTPGTSEAELLAVATRDDPTLLAPFEHLRVRVLRLDRDAVVLVCSADGRHALAEDAGCTTPVEHDWACEGRDMPCAFTDAADSCFGPTDLRGAAPAP